MKKLIHIIFFLSVLLSSCGNSSNGDCKKCADFDSQAEAKAYANKNKDCKKRLDNDGDGKFCESLPKD